MNASLRILHLEDDPADAWLVQRTLKSEGVAAEVTVVETRAEFEAALANGRNFDMVLADYQLPGFDGLIALNLLRARYPHTPFLFVTGIMGEERAVETLKSGATDYVLKDHLARLPMAVRRAMLEAEEHIRRQQAEELLRQHREWLRVTLNSIGEAVLATDPDGRITFCNPVAEKLTGWQEKEALGQSVRNVFRIIHDLTREPVADNVEQVLREGRAVHLADHIALIPSDGREILIELTAAPIKDNTGRVSGVVFVFHDITERKRAELALQWELAVNEAVSRLSVPLISPETTIEEVADAVLAQALKLTGSPDGVVSTLDPETDRLVSRIFTKVQSGECAVPGGQGMLFERGADGKFPGLWGHALNTGRAFYTNQPTSCHPAAKGLPDGHVPLKRLLAMPVFLGKELVGEILVANSERDYDDKDISAVNRLAERCALAIQRLRFKHALQGERDFVHAILTTAGALVLVVDTEGRVVRFNKACESASGYSIDEASGKVFWELVLPAEEVEPVKAVFTQLLAGHFPSYYENDWLSKSGARRRIMWSNTVLLDENKAVRYVIATGVDVTQTREAEDKLRVLTRAMEAGPSSVVITDAQGTITYVNPTFAHLTGFTPEEVLGKNPRIWKSDYHPAQYYGEMWRRLARGLEWRGEFCNKKKNGDLFWIYSTISPIMDETGAISHYVGVTVDITERKRYEQALHEARQGLEQKVAERTADLEVTIRSLQQAITARERAEAEIREAELEGQRLREELARVTRITTADHLAASLAHELRQPLAAILSNAEAAEQFLTLEPPDLKEVGEALRDIVQNDERASQVIQRLRALYRRTGHERTQVDINRLIEETLSLLGSELVIRQVSCEQQLDPRLPAVPANRVELQQVLMNLVFNARDAMSINGADTRRLTIGTRVESQSLIRVSVSDSGTGISPETAARLFEPFFTTKDSGMGMGLAISRSIIEAHGGRLWVENNPDRGATFHFTVPVTDTSS